MLINLLAERAKPEFCKDDMIIAPGKRSAAGAKQEKGRVGFGGRYSGRRSRLACPGLLSACPSGGGRWRRELDSAVERDWQRRRLTKHLGGIS